MMAGLREGGLTEGADYVIKVQNAQGDMSTVNGMVDAAVSEGADLLITLSAPTLQAALQRAAIYPLFLPILPTPLLQALDEATKITCPM